MDPGMTYLAEMYPEAPILPAPAKVESYLSYAANLFETQTFWLGRPALLPHQLPPDQLTTRESNLWLLEGGRGSGKTEAMSRYFSEYMRSNPGVRGRIIAPTFGDAVEACITGPSGLQAVDDQVVWHPSTPGGAKVSWPNGSEALVIGTHAPRDVDRLRAGGNRHIDWWEEMAANRQLAEAWKQAKFGLRLGQFPHSIASTTPRTTPTYKVIRNGTNVVRVHATMYDNPYLSAAWVKEMEATYANTRTGRQEIGGLLLEDVEGALWTLAEIQSSRLAHPIPDLARITTSVDPSGSEDGDATGIVTVGRAPNSVIYVLSDATCNGPAEHRYEEACLAASRHGADEILFESNYGGDNVRALLRSTWQHLVNQGRITADCPKLVKNPAKGSKAQRAEPVAGLFQQHHAGTERIWFAEDMPELWDEMTTWEPNADWSPNRLDAMVHGVRKNATRIGRADHSGRTSNAAATLAAANLGAPGRQVLPTLNNGRR